MSVQMRAKLLVTDVRPGGCGDDDPTVRVFMCAVGGHAVAAGYPDDGADDDNDYARWSPSADFSILIQNPALADKFKPGQKFYVDFTEAEK